MDDVRSVPNRSIVLAGHKTSISLEDEFWKGLKEIAQERHITPSELISAIDADRQNTNLSSAIRLFVLRDAPAEWSRQYAMLGLSI
jgi:predicted DNA-binding ribbon-helix-helix protein